MQVSLARSLFVMLGCIRLLVDLTRNYLQPFEATARTFAFTIEWQLNAGAFHPRYGLLAEV